MVAELQELFVEHRLVVFRFAYKRLGCRTVADDVTAEVFRAAVDARSKNPGCELNRGWLLTVARRRVADHWRVDAKQRSFMRRMELEEWVDEDVLSLESLQPVLRTLPCRQRTAVCLRYVFDLPVAAVAEHLDCSYQCAESLLARGRRRLAVELVV